MELQKHTSVIDAITHSPLNIFQTQKDTPSTGQESTIHMGSSAHGMTLQPTLTQANNGAGKALYSATDDQYVTDFLDNVAKYKNKFAKDVEEFAFDHQNLYGGEVTLPRLSIHLKRQTATNVPLVQEVKWIDTVLDTNKALKTHLDIGVDLDTLERRFQEEKLRRQQAVKKTNKNWQPKQTIRPNSLSLTPSLNPPTDPDNNNFSWFTKKRKGNPKKQKAIMDTISSAATNNKLRDSPPDLEEHSPPTINTVQVCHPSICGEKCPALTEDPHETLKRKREEEEAGALALVDPKQRKLDEYVSRTVAPK